MKNRKDRMKWGVWAVALGAVTSLSPAFAQSYSTNVFASESLFYADKTDAWNVHNGLGVAGQEVGGANFSPPPTAGNPYLIRTLLRFNMPSTNLPQVGQAILHFRALSANAPTDPSFVPNYVSDDSWSGTTTWATQPSSFTALSGYTFALSGFGSHLITNAWPTYGEYTADVTEFFTNNPGTEGQGQTMSILIRASEGNGTRWTEFYARNGVDTVGAANANVFLEMTFVPEPSAMMLALAATVCGVLARRKGRS